MAIYKLGDVANIKMCKRVTLNQTRKDEIIPFYTIGTLGNIADRYISENLWQELINNYNYPKPGTALITASGKIVKFDGKKSYFQDSNIVWLESENLLSDYIYYWLKKEPFLATHGSTIKRLYNSDIRSTKIFIPTKERQQEIIDIIKPIEDSINIINRIIKLQKKTFILSTNTDKTINNYVDNINTGYAYKKKDKVCDGIYNIFTIKNISGSFKYDKTNLSKDNILEIGNVITGLSGTIGTATTITSNNLVSNQRTLALKTKYPIQLALALEKQKITLNNISTGAVQKNITANNILSLRFEPFFSNNFDKNILLLKIQKKQLITIKNNMIQLLIK